ANNGGCFSKRLTAWRRCKVRDWREQVKRKLGPLGLDPRREAEIIRELADHLEEAPDGAGSLDLVNWEMARREIRRAELEEGSMNYRTKTVWFPGLLTST